MSRDRVEIYVGSWRMSQIKRIKTSLRRTLSSTLILTTLTTLLFSPSNQVVAYAKKLPPEILKQHLRKSNQTIHSNYTWNLGVCTLTCVLRCLIPACALSRSSLSCATSFWSSWILNTKIQCFFIIIKTVKTVFN